MSDNPSSATKPLRVLLWSPRGCGTHYYGPGSFHYRLYGSAEPGRFDVTLVHSLREQQPHELFSQQHFLAPLPGHEDPPWTRWSMTQRYLKQADQFLREHHGEFDIFHGLTGFLSTIQPALMAQKLGLPSVVFIANHLIDLHDSARLQRLLHLAHRRQNMAKQLSATVAMSTAIVTELRTCGIDESRIVRIPMAVNVERFRPPRDDVERTTLRQELNWPDRPTLLFVGRIGRRKRPNLLIESIGEAKKLGLDSQAVIAGPCSDEVYMQEMKDRAAELGVTDQVIWAGFHEDPAPLYRAADVYTLPSANEGMPAALVEAMASGLPCIVTRISGSEDLVIDHETGRFIEPTPEQAAKAWIDYLRDEPMRQQHGQAARLRAERDYSTTRVLEQYEQLFRRIRT